MLVVRFLDCIPYVKQLKAFLPRNIQELGEAFAAQAAIAIQNAKLHKELQDHAAKLEQTGC